MNFFKNIFSSTYEELWKAVIRPNRDKYRDKDLGPEKFSIKDKWYKRTDFTIRNKRNLKLMCSFWEPFDEEREYPRLPCVIYLHGNSSSRCEVIPEIKYLLPRNITLFAFDFSGCGRSEGEYISLGWHEQEDVECVVNFLRKSNKVSTIGIWGRSMGATTALMYGSRDYSIGGLVLDSPFSSLRVLIDELARDRVSLPDFIVKQALKWIKEIIKEKADFNLDDIEPKEYAGKCFMPAYFCHSKGDTFVNIHHCKDLYNLYKGDKDIVYVKGNHNTERPIHFKDAVVIFFYKCLRVKELIKNNKKENLCDFKFNNENSNYYKHKSKTNISINSNNKNNNNNNSTSEVKISLRGKYNKNNSIEYINKNKLSISNKKEKEQKSLLSKSDKDIILNIDDNISIKKIIECPQLKTNSNYIKYINEVDHSNNIIKNNKKINLNKTPSKNIREENKNKKLNKTYDKVNKVQNDNNEDEAIQKILKLSKKEFEEISTNTPSFMNSYIGSKYYHNKTTTLSPKKSKNKMTKKNSHQNSIAIDNTKSVEINIANATIPMKSKPSIFSAESIYLINNSKINNKNECSNNKVHTINNIRNPNKSNKIKLNKKNKNNNNNIFKNIKENKNNKNATYISTYMNNCPKPTPIKLKFPDLILQFNKNNNKSNARPINIKNIKKQYNFNNISIHHIFNLKNNNKKNLKLKDSNLKKEEHKNYVNNKRYDFLENVIASPLNNIVHGSINKNKNIQYVNTTNNTNNSNHFNNFVLNNYIRKSESSIDNESDTIVNSKNDNKFNESLIYLDDDNFFMEEDNIGINIPHS